MPPFIRDFSSLKMSTPKYFSGPGHRLGSATITELESTQPDPEKPAEPTKQSSNQESCVVSVYNGELVATNHLADHAEQEVEGDINFGPRSSAAKKEGQQTRPRVPRPGPKSILLQNFRAEAKLGPMSTLFPRPTTPKPKQQPDFRTFNASIVHSNMLTGHAKQKTGGSLNFGG